jgi:hypothetical protein
MARFPKTEAEVVILAQAIVSGMAVEGPGVPNPNFPAPPVTPSALQILIVDYTAAKNALTTAQVAAEQATALKDEKLVTLIDGMKSDIRYAENTVNFDDEMLKLIGWGGRKAPTALEPPGQSLLLEARNQGEGMVAFTWKAPVDGGKPSAYRILRRERPAGPWGDVGTAVVTEASLADQPRGKEFEYRIVSINKAGEGEPSNTVLVVL